MPSTNQTNRSVERLLWIGNRSREVASTNCWRTLPAMRGLIYCSVNANAFRLLVPESCSWVFPETQSARGVVISRPRFVRPGEPDGFEFLWDDGTDTPFAVQLYKAQIDRPNGTSRPTDSLECLMYREGEGDEPVLWGRWAATLHDVSRITPLGEFAPGGKRRD